MTADELHCRSTSCSIAAPQISGPKFFALANPLATSAPRARFTLPKFFVEKANLGMNSRVITTTKAKGVVNFDDQRTFQVDVGYVAARQKAIELAMVVDEDCYELGTETIANGCGLME